MFAEIVLHARRFVPSAAKFAPNAPTKIFAADVMFAKTAWAVRGIFAKIAKHVKIARNTYVLAVADARNVLLCVNPVRKNVRVVPMINFARDAVLAGIA